MEDFKVENQQQQYQQQQYQQQSNFNNGIVSVKDWLITMLLMCIPFVNFIMLFIWAFGGNVNPSKSNWAKAALIWMLIGIALSILLSLAFGALFISAMSSGYNY